MKKCKAIGPALALTALIVSLSHAQTGGGPGNSFDQTAIRSVISGQISAFRSGDHEQAYSYAAPSIRTMSGSVDRFIGMVKKGYLPVYAPRNYTFGEIRYTDNEVVQQVYVTGPRGKSWIALYTLQLQAGGEWKISGCYLQPDSGKGA